MNKRQESDLRTRVQWINAARDLFRTFGFPSITVRALAEAADTSTGALFHKWTGKEALFEEAMDRDWPDPAAFARFILRCTTIEQARAGAAVFLGDVAGENREGRVWECL